LWHKTLAGEPDGCPPSEKSFLQEYRWLNFRLSLLPWPDMEQYFELVEGYNTRNLTFESDALNAFSAITTAISNSFPGGFL
jgi:hypothetical protein